MVKNVVLIRMVGTMTEFKQIIGRGTRLREDYGKYFFNILDYTGTATRHFADPEFDGDPEFISEEEIDDEGNSTSTTVIEPGEDGGEVIIDVDPPEGPVIIEPPEPPAEPRKFYVESGAVGISAHVTQDLDAEGRRLRVSEFRDFTGEIVRSLFTGAAEFRAQWAHPEQRAELLAELANRGIDPAEAGEALGNPDADPFDLLCHVAWNAPVLTRAERAARLRKEHPTYFQQHGEQAREILDALLEKYADHGPSEFTIPDSLKVPPLSDFGNVSEITRRFGTPDQFRRAVAELQELLYAA